MRPKKIYISAKALEQPTTKDGEPKAMRVKTFSSKGDVEYVDLSQYWHDPLKELPVYMEGTIVIYENGEFGWCTNRHIRVSSDGNNPAVRWAYIKDFMPQTTKPQTTKPQTP